MLEFEFIKKGIFSDFPESEGCCFGTLDSSRLRKPFSQPLISKKTEKNEFKLGKENNYYIEMCKGGSLIKYSYKGEVIWGDTKARVITSLDGTSRSKSKFLENKLTYHDRKTGERFFIYKIFRE